MSSAPIHRVSAGAAPTCLLFCLLAFEPVFAFVPMSTRMPSKAMARSPHVVSSAKPFDEPGNYVSAYSSALGVSAAAVLCGELIRLPNSADALVPMLGRLAAVSSLPTIGASLACLRAAAFAGPALLRNPAYVRLNLGVALASIAACTISPRPVLSVMVARGGTALLCLEVWSQSIAAAKAGDPFGELRAAARGMIGAVGRAIELCARFAGAGTGGGDGERVAAGNAGGWRRGRE